MPTRGRAFEDEVHGLLTLLKITHPDRVEIMRQPSIILQNQERVVVDFKLTYETLDQKNHRLIECQDREVSSQEVVRKMGHVRAKSDKNRFMFVYRDALFLTDAVRDTLKADGIPHYDLVEFADFLRRLSAMLFAARVPLPDADFMKRALALDKPIDESIDWSTLRDKITNKEQVSPPQPIDNSEFLARLIEHSMKDPSLGRSFLDNIQNASLNSSSGKDEAMLTSIRKPW